MRCNYWGYNPLIDLLLTSWNIQVGGKAPIFFVMFCFGVHSLMIIFLDILSDLLDLLVLADGEELTLEDTDDSEPVALRSCA